MAESTTGHIHNWALGALVEESGETMSEVARRCGADSAVVGGFISGRRAGQGPALRSRLADALEVDVWAITCLCDDRAENHIEGAPAKAGKARPPKAAR